MKSLSAVEWFYVFYGNLLRVNEANNWVTEILTQH